MLTEKPSGRPALASSAFALATSNLYGFSASAPRNPIGKKA